MQVEVSMYLETVGSRRMPVSVPGSEAEERRISSVAGTLGLLQPHEERLVLGRPGVRVHRRGRQQVRERALVLRVAREAPMDGEADLPDLLAVDGERLQTLRDHRRALDLAARGHDLHPRAVGDPL